MTVPTDPAALIVSLDRYDLTIEQALAVVADAQGRVSARQMLVQLGVSATGPGNWVRLSRAGGVVVRLVATPTLISAEFTYLDTKVGRALADLVESGDGNPMLVGVGGSAPILAGFAVKA